MATPSSSKTERRTSNVDRRGAFYSGIGYSLIVGLIIVVGLGVLGVSGLGWFTLTSAMAMIGLSIGLLGVVAVITLMSMRRTLNMLSRHDKAIAEQSERYAELASDVHENQVAVQAVRDREQDEAFAARQAGQRVRDWQQDDMLANLSDRDDARFVDEQQRAEQSRTTRTPAPDPFAIEGAEIHPIEDVEGIGGHYGEELQDLGITDTQELWYADAVSVAGALDIDPSRVRDWQGMAELMTVDGIAKQYAELLVRANVASIPELTAQNPERLKSRIHKLEGRLKKRVQGNKIGTKIIETWIHAAKAHHNGGQPNRTPNPGGGSR